VLGKLEISGSFSVTLEGTQPFKLAEKYYTCTPFGTETFYEQLGIGESIADNNGDS
jgi:hypothetical protein